ncbi:unnamed protein product, partial [Prorocentrum cordatum]
PREGGSSGAVPGRPALRDVGRGLQRLARGPPGDPAGEPGEGGAPRGRPDLGAALPGHPRAAPRRRRRGARGAWPRCLHVGLRLRRAAAVAHEPRRAAPPLLGGGDEPVLRARAVAGPPGARSRLQRVRDWRSGQAGWRAGRRAPL